MSNELAFMWSWMLFWTAASIYGSGLSFTPFLSWSKPRLRWLSGIFLTIFDYQFNLIHWRLRKSPPHILTLEDLVKSKWYYQLIIDATSTAGYSFDEKLQRYFWCVLLIGGLLGMVVLGVFFGA